MHQRVRSVVLHSGGLASATLIAMAEKMYGPDGFGVVTYRAIDDKRLHASVQLAQHYGINNFIQRTPRKNLRKRTRDLNMVIETADQSLARFPNLRSLVIGSHLKAGLKPDIARIELWQNVISDLFNEKVTLQAPFIDKKESYIVDQAVKFDVPLDLARNCESDTDKFCGECRSCRIRISAFKEMGYMDYEYEGIIDFGLTKQEQQDFEKYLAEGE